MRMIRASLTQLLQRFRLGRPVFRSEGARAAALPDRSEGLFFLFFPFARFASLASLGALLALLWVALISVACSDAENPSNSAKVSAAAESTTPPQPAETATSSTSSSTTTETTTTAGDPASDDALVAAFVVVDGVYNTELMAPWDVLHHTQGSVPDHPGIEVLLITPDGEPVRTYEGLRIAADYSFSDAPPIDILLVPSAEHSRDQDLDNEAYIRFVGERGQEAEWVVSFCWGAFVLAEAGLLDGHAMTTFPSDYRTFTDRFPDLDLRINVSWVHDKNRLTSAGGAKSYDAAMYLVDRIFGQEIAQRVGGGLLIDWPLDPTCSDRIAVTPSNAGLVE